MVVSNLIFDITVYGALLLALAVDFLVPGLHGVVTLLAVCTATYVTAEDGALFLQRRGWWSQESLATAISLSIAAFIYYWWRNDSDIIAVGLHIGLMMAALMALIACIAAIGAIFQTKSLKPLAGLVFTKIGATALGLMAGAVVFYLTSDAVPIQLKLGPLLAAALVWKLREGVRPPTYHEQPPRQVKSVTPAKTSAPAPGLVPAPTPTRVFAPQRGTLLDRFVPVLLVYAVAFVLLRGAMGLK